MLTKKNHTMAGLVLVGVASLALVGCSMGTAPAESPAEEPTGMSQEPMETDAAMDPAYDNLVGAGCAMYDEQVPDGAGSIVGMSQDPVAVAASNNPILTTLVAAVSGQLNPDVDLVDTLNGDEFTVFAPVDDAFAALPAETVELLGTPEGAETLSTVLTYHVVPGQIAPDAIVGEHTTVQSEDLEVTGSGDELMVNGATVICGGVQTANATVYLIDTVLMPPSMG
ncbi:fasciclin domain-containing protein [Agrococcus sp. ARC_14]|uniref:fasciclin domain-containing protein n=1 Tax=Agrococcus sp. ARC_14 TaxID=2919927 RepID=UPI001F06E415|nr:fasciclin domain-containing protein [Agrococcus sp. ARC_14]MCH1883439.1 fasciclin domain-containing protein [Agrococcus sp. ARC_14]